MKVAIGLLIFVCLVADATPNALWRIMQPDKYSSFFQSGIKLGIPLYEVETAYPASALAFLLSSVTIVVIFAAAVPSLLWRKSA